MRFGQSRIRLKHLEEDNKTLTILIGPNGSGKSMSLRELEDEINKKYNGGTSYSTNPLRNVVLNDDNKINIPVFVYKTSHDDIVHRSMDFDPYKLAQAFRSEGERMCASFNEWASTEFLRNFFELKPKEYYLLLDEIDSGLSPDRIKITNYDFFSIIKHELKIGNKPHVIVTCNSYELLESLKNEFPDNHVVYWLPTKKKVDINSYNDFSRLYDSRYKTLLKEREEDDLNESRFKYWN